MTPAAFAGAAAAHLTKHQQHPHRCAAQRRAHRRAWRPFHEILALTKTLSKSCKIAASQAGAQHGEQTITCSSQDTHGERAKRSVSRATSEASSRGKNTDFHHSEPDSNAIHLVDAVSSRARDVDRRRMRNERDFWFRRSCPRFCLHAKINCTCKRDMQPFQCDLLSTSARDQGTVLANSSSDLGRLLL